MNKRGKSWHLIVTALLIVVFSFTALFGVSYTYGDTKNVYIKGAEDIRFGIDIRGGVDVTFMPADGVEATDDQMTAAKTVIEDRLVGLGITDYEDYVDYNKDRIIVRFPWKTGETDFNPQTAIDEIGTTAEMVFRKGSTADGEEILSGDDVTSATAGYNQENGYVVQLQFSADGAKKFAEATTELAAQSNGTISIWLDGENISTATVKTAITDGNAVIEGSFTQDQVTALANQINSGSLPFALSAESFSTISPTLGAKSLDVMVLAGIIAFAFVALLMIVRYRLPGTIAVISLFGQVVATLAFVSGYFTVFNGSTLTLPGIAGIILGIGMGVDANVITAERIKEELGNGKTLDGAIASGFKMGLTPIIDGNVTIVIVAALLMGAFGPTDGFWGKVFNPIFFMFGPSTAGSIYSFGFTLLTSVLLNFVFGVFATRIMIRGASRCKVFRNPVLYGGSKDGKKTYKCPNINFVGNRKKFYTFSGVLVAVVLVFSFVYGSVHLSLTKYAQWDTDSDLIAETYDSVQEVKEALPDDAFYRIDAYGAHNNLGLWFDKSCLQFFNSTVAPSIMEFYPEVGVKRDVNSKPEVQNYALRGLLSVRYTLVAKDADSNWQGEGMDGWDLVGSTSAYQIYENKNWVPMGFAQQYYVTADQLDQVGEDSRAQVLLRAVLLDEDQIAAYGDLLQPIPDDRLTNCTQDTYAEDCTACHAEAVGNFTATRTGFTAETDYDTDRLVFFSVPYDDGFTAAINGKTAKIEKVDNGLMALRVPAGQTSITCTYHTPGLRTGTIISLAALAVYGAYLVVLKRKKCL